MGKINISKILYSSQQHIVILICNQFLKTVKYFEPLFLKSSMQCSLTLDTQSAIQEKQRQ